jgi:diadenylate cyclase
MLDQVINFSVILIVIIFQPEIRRFLEEFGKKKWAVPMVAPSERPQSNPERIAEEIGKATNYLAKRKIGALIVISGDTMLGEYIETGIKLDADISSELLINIFIPNTPLHDGAVIVTDGILASASSFLPLTNNQEVSMKFGTRHRAAIGMSEVSDALVITVSEETGYINVAKSGVLYENLTSEELELRIIDFLPHEDEQRGFAHELAHQIIEGGK